MKRYFLFLISVFMLAACSEEKVYHSYVDFDNRKWAADNAPKFTFSIDDTTQRYNVYCNVRNSTLYPWSRIFIQYQLGDTLGHVYDNRLLQAFLFDAKTGEPFGQSGLGDLYDHQISILNNYKFKKAGPYRVTLQQYMRTEELEGVVSVGVGVERTIPE